MITPNMRANIISFVNEVEDGGRIDLKASMKTGTKESNGMFIPYKILDEETIVEMSVPFKRRCGIYFLISANKIVYIGQSADIYTRVSSHKREGKKHFTRFAFIEAPIKKIGGLENAYKAKYKPKYNKQDLPWSVYSMS